MKRSCLLVCYTDLAKDPRVIKHFRALEGHFDVYTVGLSSIGAEKDFVQISNFSVWDSLVKYSEGSKLGGILLFFPIRVGNFLRFRVFSRFYFLRYWTIGRLIDFAKMQRFKDVDLIVANDINTLPLAVALAGKKTKLVYDAHEYHSEEQAERKFWVHYNRPLIKYLYSRYIFRTDMCLTVGENIAKRYELDYGRRFEVILNASPYYDIKTIQVDQKKIKLIYSGLYGPNRNVDQIIYAMDQLPERFELHLLVTNQQESLKAIIASSASKTRIFLHQAVALKEVVPYLSQFDIGVHLMAPLNYNNENALPNKYFQYIQARLVTVFGPLKEIKQLTEKHNTGFISPGFQAADLVDVLSKVTSEEIRAIKKNNEHNAKQFCEENEIVKLKEIYKHVMQ